MVRFYVGVDELGTFWRGVLVSVRILTAKCARCAKEKSLSRVSRAFVFAAKNLYAHTQRSSPALHPQRGACVAVAQDDMESSKDKILSNM